MWVSLPGPFAISPYISPNFAGTLDVFDLPFRNHLIPSMLKEED